MQSSCSAAGAAAACASTSEKPPSQQQPREQGPSPFRRQLAPSGPERITRRVLGGRPSTRSGPCCSRLLPPAFSLGGFPCSQRCRTCCSVMWRAPHPASHQQHHHLHPHPRPQNHRLDPNHSPPPGRPPPPHRLLLRLGPGRRCISMRSHQSGARPRSGTLLPKAHRSTHRTSGSPSAGGTSGGPAEQSCRSAAIQCAASAGRPQLQDLWARCTPIHQQHDGRCICSLDR